RLSRQWWVLSLHTYYLLVCYMAKSRQVVHNRIGKGPVAQVRVVPRSNPRIRVPQELADSEQIRAALCQQGGVSVAELMKSNARLNLRNVAGLLHWPDLMRLPPGLAAAIQEDQFVFGLPGSLFLKEPLPFPAEWNMASAAAF